MTDRDTDRAAARLAVDHGERSLVGLPAGGFALEGGGQAIRVKPAAGGWSIEGADPSRSWSLRREPSGGFVLHDADQAEVGRTLPPWSVEDGHPRYLLLADGRLFRVVLRGPTDARFELSGWETSGAYLVARPGPRGFTLMPTPACGGIADIRALSLLFAAEILDAEQPLPGRVET